MQPSPGTESKRFEDLVAWQRAMDLVDRVYQLTRGWPADECFGLTAQVRRAVVLVPANIAEGQGRNGQKEFAQHLGIAFASLCEVETQVRIGTRQGFHDAHIETDLLGKSREVARLLNGLINSLRRSSD